MIKLQVIGNVGQDARIHDVNGRKAINFSVAHNRRYKTAEGTDVEETIWVNCSYWKNPDQSVKVGEFVIAGTKVFVEGNPTVSIFKGKDGKPQASLNLNVINMQILSVRKDDTAGEKNENETVHQTAGEVQEPVDDLPF